MRSLMAVVFGVFLLAGSAFAMCGTCGKGEACAHSKGDDKSSVLMTASKELEASNPELAAKVKAIAADCCKHQLHNEEHAHE